MPDAQITLPPDTRSVSAARSFAVRRLHDWDAESLEWLTTQVISELVTNAVLHARSCLTVTLTYSPARVLRVDVHDDSPQRPVVRHYPEEATTGRGLALVDQLSSGWGVRPDDSGKSVWCELACDDDPSGEPRDIRLDRHVPGRDERGRRLASGPVGTQRVLVLAPAA